MCETKYFADCFELEMKQMVSKCVTVSTLAFIHFRLTW